MQDHFNQMADFFDPNARVVNLPAHTVLEIDYWAVGDDGRQGLLKGYTTADIEREYGTQRLIPAQAFAFTSWEKLPYDFPSETRKLLQTALDEDDRSTPDALKGRVLLSRPLTLKKGG